MRKAYSFFIIAFLAVIVFAFYPVDDANNNGIDTPSYEIAKHKFWEEYQVYRNNLDNGIKTTPPIDPSGNFVIDENGNFNMVNHGNVQNGVYNPQLSPDALSIYTFSQLSTTYTSINGTGTMVPGSTGCDDGTFAPFNIGFTFAYNGTNYTQFGCGCNGYVTMGPAVATGGYAPLSANADNNVIAPFANDLQGAATGSIFYQTTGVAPYRVCTVEFYQWGFWPQTGNELSFEVKLFETTNAVQIIYQSGSHITTNNMQVGMRGASNADVLNRTSTTGWANTTAGGVNTATVSFSPTLFPAAGLTFQYSPAPVTPTLLTPANHSVGQVPVNLAFTWSASAGATSYRYQLATDSLFTAIVINQTFPTPLVNVSGFPPLSTWWWRVSAIGPNGTSTYQIPWTFKIMGAPTQSTLLLPANNAVNQPIALTCVWSKAVDQTLDNRGPFVQEAGSKTTKPELKDNVISNYWYELYTDTTIVPVIRDSTLIDTTRALSGLTNSTNYWWRVKAKNQIGWGAFTAYFKFTTIIAAPPAPSLISPPNNSIGIPLTPMLVWSVVGTATGYRCQLSSDSTFATTQLDTIVSVDSVQVPAGRLSNNVRYYWHVRSQNIGGNSAYTGLFNFTSNPVGISHNGNEIPKVFKLYNNYPNPFNPASTIKFDVPIAADVKMIVYNMLGQEVSTLVNSHLGAGAYSVQWDASNFPSGVYFYKITAGNFTDIHKMVLVK